MLLTLTSTTPPATDLGFLLHKNPARRHEVPLSFGVANVVYPEAGDSRCTAALIVDVNPVELIRGPKGQRGKRGARRNPLTLGQYVNDRPYAASSLLSVALSKVFGTAMTGRSKDRPDLAQQALPFEVHLPVVPCRGGPDLLRRVLEPLGYTVEVDALPLDATVPEWGDSGYVDLRMHHREVRLRDVLEHLYVLLPVFDDDKHYWVGDDEVDKLLRRGGDWLVAHPERALITRRYMRHDRRLTRAALGRLVEADGAVVDPDPDADQEHQDAEEAAVERPVSLNTQRIAAVTAALRQAGARRIVDLGCGEGTLLRALLEDSEVEQVVGVDVAWRALEKAARRLRLGEMSPRQRARVELWQGALTYRDKRLRGFDAAVAVEVVEHLDPSRLGAFERALFDDAQPATVIVTTPNVEYNPLFEGLPAGRLRHRDHRFEWTRAELGQWADGVAERHGYRVVVSPIGPLDAARGAPTQMAVFSR